jgi:hypothetical protein
MFIQIPYLWFYIFFFFFKLPQIFRFPNWNHVHRSYFISQYFINESWNLYTLQAPEDDPDNGENNLQKSETFKCLSSLGDSKTKCSIFDIPITTAWLMTKTLENLCMFLDFVKLETIIELHFPYFLVFAFSKFCCTNTLGIRMEPHPIN